MSMFELDLGRLGPSADDRLLTTISEPPEMPQTKNVVATLNVKCKLDLKEIVTKSRNSEYNPKRFAACILRIRQPKSTALIFASGKIVITGAKTTDDAFISARKYVRILQKLEFPAKFTDYKVVNIVACCSAQFPIRLESLAHFKPQNASYEPELFPGLIYRMSEPKVVILIFVSGKIVLTGAKKKEEIDQSFRRLWPILQKFRKQYQLQSNHNHGEEQDMDLDDLDDADEDEPEYAVDWE